MHPDAYAAPNLYARKNAYKQPNRNHTKRKIFKHTFNELVISQYIANFVFVFIGE